MLYKFYNALLVYLIVLNCLLYDPGSVDRYQNRQKFWKLLICSGNTVTESQKTDEGLKMMITRGNEANSRWHVCV